MSCRSVRSRCRALGGWRLLTLLGALLFAAVAVPWSASADSQEASDAGPGMTNEESAAAAEDRAMPAGAEAMPESATPAEKPVSDETSPSAGAGEGGHTPRVVAQFTTAVENREPIDQVTFVSNDTRKIYFFTDLRNLEGHVVTHRWLHGGKTMAEVDFQVRGPRWRVWSTKQLLPDWIGDWTVEVVTEGGEVIAAETFTYSPPQG